MRRLRALAIVLGTTGCVGSDARPSAWRFRAPDSVTVLLHANMRPSWALDLQGRGDSLLGVARSSSDSDADTSTVRIVARRATCPPAEASADRAPPSP